MFKFEEISSKVGQKIQIEGFVKVVRVQSKMAFVVLESGASRIQCVCFGTVKELAAKLSVQSYAQVEGIVVASVQAPGGVEVQVKSLELLSHAMQWPISEESDIGKKLDWPVARFRERKEAVTQIAMGKLEFYMMAHLQEKGFMALHSPKLGGAPSESGSEVFEVKYFDQKAYLQQSPQFFNNHGYA